MRCSSAFLFSQWAVDLIVDEVCNVNHDMSWMSRLAMQQDSIQMSFNSCDVGIWHVLNFPCYAASFNLTFSLWAPSCKGWVNSVHEMSLSCDVMHVEMRTPVDDRGMHLRFWDSKKCVQWNAHMWRSWRTMQCPKLDAKQWTNRQCVVEPANMWTKVS